MNAHSNMAHTAERADGINEQTARNQANQPNEKSGLGGDRCKLHDHNNKQKDFPGACQTEHSLLSAEFEVGKLESARCINQLPPSQSRGKNEKRWA
jgi:hypothetical protein